jgi:glycosyltransferase involved in cell wall biosynthesis
MTKIAFISTMAVAPWGGSEELWSRSALRLRQHGFEVAANISRWSARIPQVDALKNAGVLLTRRTEHSASIASKVFSKVAHQLRNVNAGWVKAQAPSLVVISQGGNRDGVEWMEACIDAGVPFVVIVQCNHEQWWPDDKGRARAARAYREAQRVFCVSHENLRLLEDQIAEDLQRATVVWNPCNVPDGPPPPWPSNGNTLRLACVARLEPATKGQDLLIRVLSMPRWKERPVEVDFYGRGSCEDGLKKLAQRLGATQVNFYGHVENVRAIWESHHMFLLASRFEGLPLALVESMYCARPAVVTDVGDSGRLCVDGATGFVAAAPTLKLVDETLTRAWTKRAEWERMGQNARLRVEQLIPRDQIGAFCDCLLSCLPTTR